MSLEYIRKTYNVPAYRGRRVRYHDQDGVQWNGRITSARGGHLRVLVDDRVPGYRGRMLLHPTWNMEYLAPGTLQERRDQNPVPVHGCGHMQRRGAA
jgi:hypothetical protein